MENFSALQLAHKIIAEHVRAGDICIDATAGRGKDTAFLCSIVGESGRVIALDIQDEAVRSTNALIKEKNYDSICGVYLDCHSNIGKYAQDGTVSCITFNFGWLPAGDHNVFTCAQTSIPAIESGLKLLKNGGVMSLCIYYGGVNGFGERDALLEYLKTVDNYKYTVILSQFYNRPNNPPIPVFIIKSA